ncbi:Protein-lysine N-methyltransferase Efm4/METTL10 protein [Dioscorea alata]|uniref:Protein-lysine N-methyltransferase Efm4/METTL10 protein n=1 Tax=Dioscorea alata TaxID=55571 RepID=A0ACB7UE55_DIOAL|nr:Protein-lysine N-methyltransferase Efm4/METTL10 protein [Dioscorea alata]
MAGIRWPPEDSDLFPARPAGATVTELISDDDRSVAADSWSIKSDYGSTLDDEQRHVDASEVLSASNFPAASDYSSDKEEPDANEVEPSMLGLQSYWDATYAEDLVNFHEHGHAGEIWFGAEVMDVVVSWTKNLCANMSGATDAAEGSSSNSESGETVGDLSTWSVLDVGTGNGLLLQELAKQGFSDLTGIDYSEAGIELAHNLAVRDGFAGIKFVVADVLDAKLDRKYQLVMDKGTLDAIGLHPDGPVKRMMYWESVANMVASGGLLVITSCNSTKDELLQEVDNFNKRFGIQDQVQEVGTGPADVFRYVDHVRTFPTIIFGGVEGSRVSTVAFVRN